MFIDRFAALELRFGYLWDLLRPTLGFSYDVFGVLAIWTPAHGILHKVSSTQTLNPAILFIDNPEPRMQKQWRIELPNTFAIAATIA